MTMSIFYECLFPPLTPWWTCLVFLKCEIPWHNWVLKLMYILQVPHCYLFSHLSLFYWTCNCQSPLNPHKRWSDKIVFWSWDIISNYWVENNWWPWERRRRCGSRCSKRHFLNILAIRFLFLHIGRFRESALHTSWSSKVSMGSSRSCVVIWLQILWLYPGMRLSSFPSFLSTRRGSSWWGRAPCIIFQLC